MKMEPNSSHWCLLAGQGRWTQTEIEELQFKCKKTPFGSDESSGTGSPERLQSLHPWRYSEPDWTQP